MIVFCGVAVVESELKNEIMFGPKPILSLWVQKKEIYIV